MIRKKHLLTVALALSSGALFAEPQPPGGNPPPGDGGPQPPPQGERERRPPPPLIAALDTDGDGTISATEIENAPESLKKLDKNHDGKLTMDELRPPRPEGGPQGPGNNQPQPPQGDRPEGGKGGPQDGGPRKGPRDGGPNARQANAPDGQGGPGKQGGPGGPGGKRPMPPIIAALDTDGDGVISASEIASAAASLKKLDKNNDGQLTPDEYRPQPPKRDGDQQGQPRGPRDGGKPPGGDAGGDATKKRPTAE